MPCECDSDNVVVPPTHVFTTSSSAFIPLTSATSGGPINALRCRMIVEALSGNMSVRLAYQTSADLSSWSTVSAFSTARTANGTYYEASLDMTDSLFYRFGVLVENTGSGNCESALVALLLDLTLV